MGDIPFRTDNPTGHEALWESLRAGDVGAFEQVFQVYYPILLRYGLKFNDKEDEVKDLIQSLFLQIWERRAFLGPTTSIRNYLLASLRRLLHKSASLTSEYNFKLHADFQVELSPESKLIASQTEARNVELVRAAFEKLPPRQKEAIYLRFYDDQNFSEIAAVMGISVRATYKLIYKGLDNLQAELDGRDIDIGYHLMLLFLFANQHVSSVSELFLNNTHLTN